MLERHELMIESEEKLKELNKQDEKRRHIVLVVG